MANLLTINHLSYSRNLQLILKDLNLELPYGQIVGLLGTNGAGKTTLMRLIAGNYIDRKNSISINTETNSAVRKSLVSFTEQVGGWSGHPRILKIGNFYDALYEDFNLTTFNQLLSNLNLSPDQRVNQLSKGNFRKLVIAVTLARQTDLYLLDEPFDGIDSMTRKKIISSIIQWKPENATVLVSDHHVGDIANLLDQVVIIKDQHVAAQEAADTIRETLGKDIETYYEDFYREEL
ncbi:ATP-binding cassette domain-containing protein [Pediococcus pentosaceus]|uniref:ATP-binding cassette domain-containing protein n=1 Tax=Pediococcus pentosaceus TaxID=1255 RepID=UPI0018FE7697|nr:ATP-binding cassette domain-containing protein [Pediococcus pentosaceus]MBF7121630.1 ABC transporter ATP-binding protein [Pediococcus pentosaceus]